MHAHADAHKWKVFTPVRPISIIHHAVKMPGAPELLGQIFVTVVYDSCIGPEYHSLPS